MQFVVEKNREYSTKTISPDEYKILRENAAKSQSGKKVMTEEQRQRASLRTHGENNGMYGKTHTKETKQKIAQSHTGKKHPHRKGMNVFKNKNGDTIFCKVDDQRVLSGEYRGVTTGKSNYMNKNGEILNLFTHDELVLTGEVIHIHKNRIVSEETRQKLAQAQTGKRASEETKAKLSKTKKGVPKTKEHVKKVTESRMANIRRNDTKIHFFKNLTTGECIQCTKTTLEDRIGYTLRPLFDRNPPYKKCRGWCLITSEEFAEFINSTKIVPSIS